jgi:thiosulfate reductase cytochrome b subunit
MTIPDYYSLAAARDWHVLTAWVFALALLVYMIAALLNRHFQRDMTTTRAEWRPSAIWSDVRAHVKLRFEPAHGKYNFLQKASYALVLFVLLPLMIVSGMAISPGMDAAWPFLTDLFGGRQSARSIHFICAWGLAGFFVVHVVLVLLSNPLKQLREMITGGVQR